MQRSFVSVLQFVYTADSVLGELRGVGHPDSFVAMMMRFKVPKPEFHAATLLAWLLPIFAWAPLAYPGYFEFHSGFLPVFNLNDLLRHLPDFTWAATVGQPYDLLRGERALPYLLAALMRAAGAPPVVAVKWVFGAGLLAGSLGLYGWARRRLGAWPALLAATLYVYAPVVLATTYVRGAFAEAAFLGVLPWVFWAADAALAGRRAAGAGLAIALAAALWTQAGLALWLAALTLGYITASVFSGRSKPPVAAWIGWAGGLALGIVGLLPVILRRGWGGSPGIRLSDHFVYLHQLLFSGWGAGPSIAGPDDTLTFSIGAVAFGLAVLAFAGRGPAGAQPAVNSTDHAACSAPLPVSAVHRFAVPAILILLFVSTTLAAPIWRRLPFLSRALTYPWQLLLLAAPWVAWLAGLGGKRLLDLLPQACEDQAAATATRAAAGCNASEGRSGAVALIAALLVLALLGAYGSLSPLRTQTQVGEAPAAIYGDNQIALLSVLPVGAPGPGHTVALAVRWQALRPLDQDYTVFFHALGPDGIRWGQQDVMPQGGKLPTSQWQPGQVIEDRYELVISPDAPLGDYRYLLGMYQWQTGERLQVGTDDKVTVTP